MFSWFIVEGVITRLYTNTHTSSEAYLILVMGFNSNAKTQRHHSKLHAALILSFNFHSIRNLIFNQSNKSSTNFAIIRSHLRFWIYQFYMNAKSLSICCMNFTYIRKTYFSFGKWADICKNYPAAYGNIIQVWLSNSFIQGCW